MNRDKVQEEALKRTVGINRCGLGLATGVGKTLVALIFSYVRNTCSCTKTINF
jgi:superfamily II DNA or RNA helicase